MTNFCIIANRLKDKNLEMTHKVMGHLEARGCVCRLLDEFSAAEDIMREVDTLDPTTDCCIVLGGDGTIIQTASAFCRSGIPLLGINLGTLGFLSIVEQNEIEAALDAVIAGDYDIEERMLAAVEVGKQDGTHSESIAVNDVIITRSGLSRTVAVSAEVNSSVVSTYIGDGVIVATPTGSTGYNLSAGGPVVTPEAELFVLTPVCPHSLNARSIVVSKSDRIVLRMGTCGKIRPDEAIVMIDGQCGISFQTGDLVTITSADRKAKLIRLRDKSFFKVLHMKLGDR